MKEYLLQVQAIAQKLQRPMIIASSIPIYPSRKYPIVTVQPKPFAFGFMNLLMHWVIYKGLQSAPPLKLMRQNSISSLL